MINASLKFALRSLGKYKMYTLVNLLGLTLGLSAALIIGLYAIEAIKQSWKIVCDAASLSEVDRSLLWGRQFLNAYSTVVD